MSLFNTILKINGFIPLIVSENANADNEELKTIVVTVDDATNDVDQHIVNKHNVWYKNKYIRNPINMIYMACVLLIISWPSVYQIIKAIVDSDIRFITANIYSYMYLIQFILGMIYFRKKHFRLSLTYMEQYQVYLTVFCVAGIVISLVLSIVSFVLLITGLNINIYSMAYYGSSDTVRSFLAIAIFTNKMYSFSSFFANVVAFSSIFIMHSFRIKKFSDGLEELTNTKFNLTIQSIIKDFTELKEYHTKSVNKLNNLFSAITIFGIISCYFTFLYQNTSFVGIDTYIDTCCFIVIEAVYIISISRTKASASDISDIINTTTFSDLFLSKYNFEVIIGDTYDNYKKNLDTMIRDRVLETDNGKKINFIKELSLRSVISLTESNASIDWIILNDKLNADWSSFQIFGFKIDDSNLIKQLLTIIVGFFMLSNINQYLNIS